MNASDIGQLASLARTALDDPHALPDGALSQGAYEGLAKGSDVAFRIYATDRMDDIIRITDPIDTGGEEEFEAMAGSLDVLGRNVEMIRERIENLAVNRSALAPESEPLEETSARLHEALNIVDVAVATLRAIAEPVNECEDCQVNGDGCREHGEAFRVARREILANPERVVALLAEGRSS